MAGIPSRRGDGTLVFKICFYGPSLGGKTTALDWVYRREGLASGDMQQNFASFPRKCDYKTPQAEPYFLIES